MYEHNSVLKGFLASLKREEGSKLRLYHSVVRECARIFVPFDQVKGQEGFYCL